MLHQGSALCYVTYLYLGVGLVLDTDAISGTVLWCRSERQFFFCTSVLESHILMLWCREWNEFHGSCDCDVCLPASFL